MALNDRLRAARTSKGLTLDEVASKVGVSRQTIQRYESGVISNIPSDNIEKLAAALDTTPAELMGWAGPPVKVKTTMTFDGDSPMHDLTQAYLRHPKAVQDEILVRLDRLDVTFSKNVSKLLMDSGDVNGFMQNTDLDFPRVGKLMQGETVWTTPEEAERIAAYFGTDVVKLFFESEVSAAPPKTTTPTSAPAEDPVTNAFADYLENLPKPVANLLAKALNSNLRAEGNAYQVLIALAEYLNKEVDAPSYKNTNAALAIIFNPDFVKHLNKALRKFEEENPCAADVGTVARIIAEEIYNNTSTFQVLYVLNAHPARNMRTLLERKLGLD